MISEFKDGLLKKYYCGIKENLFDKIEIKKHCEAYKGLHDLSYAAPEFSGKYIDICMAYYQNEKDERALECAKKVTYAAMDGQRADGYMGMYMPGCEFGSFSIWNQAFTMFGMLSFWKVTQDKKVFQSIEKGAHYIIEAFKDRDILEAGNNGVQHLIIVLPIAMLYKITGNKAYGDFVHSVKERLKKSELNFINPVDIMKLKSQKGIEILAAYVGFLIYAEAAEDEEIIDGACLYWEQLKNTQIRNTGGGTVYELWTENGNAPSFLPKNVKPNENCVTVGWIQMSLMLFYLRRDAKYLDAVETALFNHELAAISKEMDDFCYYQPNFGKKIQGTPSEYYSCCRYRGLTLFAHLKEMLYYDDGKEIIPMIFMPSVYENEKLIIEQITDYPRNNVIEFIIMPKKKTEINFKLRLPSWCKDTRIFIDDEEIFLTPCYGFDKYFDNYFRIIRTIDKELRIRYELDMKAWYETGKIFGTDFTAVHYGPLVMAADKHFGKAPENIVFDSRINQFIRHETNEEIIRISDGCYTLVDYASAGTKNPEEDEISVWLKYSAHKGDEEDA